MANTSSRSYSRSSGGTWGIFLFIIGIIEVSYHQKDIIRISPFLIGAALALLLLYIVHRMRNRKRLRRLRATLEYADSLNGMQFEHYVADLLKKHNFTKVTLTEKYDMGVDIVAEKEGVRWGIQTKRYSGLVKTSAVRQAVAGISSYGCDRAMVITNSTFSNYAIKLARSNHCILIDRMELAKLISET